MNAQKNTQNTDNQSVTEFISSSQNNKTTENQEVTYILENNFIGTLFTYNNLQEAFSMLGDSYLVEWFNSRKEIPAKSNFIIQKIVNGNNSTIITKVKAKNLFNL